MESHEVRKNLITEVMNSLTEYTEERAKNLIQKEKNAYRYTLIAGNDF